MAYGTRNITFEARFLWFINYRTRNTTLEACFLWFMAYRTRSITFEARFLLIMAYGTRRYITFKGRLGSFVACRTRKLHLRVVSKTKLSKTKTEARSTQISKTKHPNLETTVRWRTTAFKSCMTEAKPGGGKGWVRTFKGPPIHPTEHLISRLQR